MYFFPKGRKRPVAAVQAPEISSERNTVTQLKEVLPDQNTEDSSDSGVENHSKVLHPESKKKERKEKVVVVSSTPVTPSRKKSSGKLLVLKPDHSKKVKKVKVDDSHVVEEKSEKRNSQGDKVKDNGETNIRTFPHNPDTGSSVASATHKQWNKKKKKNGQENQQQAAGKNTAKTALIQNGTKETERGCNVDRKSQGDERGAENNGEEQKSGREVKAEDTSRDKQDIREDEKEKESTRDVQKDKKEKRSKKEEKNYRSEKEGESNEEQRNRRDKESERQSSEADDSESEEQDNRSDDEENEEHKSSVARTTQKKVPVNREMNGNYVKKPLSQFSTPLLLNGEIIVVSSVNKLLWHG